jgi:hypothetical protein
MPTATTRRSSARFSMPPTRADNAISTIGPIATEDSSTMKRVRRSRSASISSFLKTTKAFTRAPFPRR